MTDDWNTLWCSEKIVFIFPLWNLRDKSVFALPKAGSSFFELNHVLPGTSFFRLSWLDSASVGCKQRSLTDTATEDGRWAGFQGTQDKKSPSCSFSQCTHTTALDHPTLKRVGGLAVLSGSNPYVEICIFSHQFTFI